MATSRGSLYISELEEFGWVSEWKKISSSWISYILFFIFGTFLFFKFYFIFKLYNIVLVLPNIKMNPPQVYMCSPSWTLLPPPSPYPPSGSSQCTSPKHPVLCIEPGLVTRFIHDIIHVSMPFSQISPPPPSPTESIRLIYFVFVFFASGTCTLQMTYGNKQLSSFFSPSLKFVIFELSD